MATQNAVCERRPMSNFPGGRLPTTLYAGDDRGLRLQLSTLQKENAVLRASLSRQLEISAAERRAREAAERSREEALRACVRARLP
jgi:hypothetical protein